MQSNSAQRDVGEEQWAANWSWLHRSRISARKLNTSSLFCFAFCHSLERQHSLFGWLWPAVLQNSDLECGHLPERHWGNCLESSSALSSPRGSHLPLLSVTPSQNPPQESRKEETCFFLIPILPYLEQGQTQTAGSMTWPSHPWWLKSWGPQISLGLLFFESGDDCDTILWILQHFFPLVFWVCSCWYNDTSENQRIMKLCAWDTHKVTAIKTFL